MSSYPSRIASPAGAGLGSGGGGAGAASATTTLFRRLVWEGSIPLEIRIDQKELPADSDRGLGESYYLQVSRLSYLPLLIPEIKQYLVELVLSEREGANVKEEQWWFEDEFGGVVKWNWPLGLLYDVYVSSKTISLAASYPPSATAPANSQPTVYPQPTTPLRLTLHLVPMGGSDKAPTHSLLGPANQEALKQSFMAQLKEADFLRWGSTKRVTGLRKAEQDGIWDSLRDHNFEDFWKVASKIIPSPVPPPPMGGPSAFHNPASTISRPPSTDPGMPSTATSLPPMDRDTAYNVRSVPIRIYLPDLPQNSSSMGSPRANNASLPGGSGFSAGMGGLGNIAGGSAMSPFHPHLAGGSLATYASTLPGSAGTGSVIQPLVPPLLDQGGGLGGGNPSSSPGSPQLTSMPLGTTGPAGSGQSNQGGQPATIRSLLEAHLPLLFPNEPLSFAGFGAAGPTLAHAIVHGVLMPPETELAWLGACMSGADGWVSIVVGLGRGV